MFDQVLEKLFLATRFVCVESVAVIVPDPETTVTARAGIAVAVTAIAPAMASIVHFFIIRSPYSRAGC